MRIIVDICHPAQVHHFRHALRAWSQDNHQVVVVARNKDITLKLLDLYGFSYVTLAPPGRGRFGQFKEFIRREVGMFKLARRCRPAIITGSSPNAARVARLLGAKSVILSEDDAAYTPLFRWLAYPLATAIVTPDCLAYEDYGVRHLTYPSYQKLFYLHPNRFTPDRAIVRELGIADDEPFGLLRLVALQAHHDVGVHGVSEDLLRAMIRLTKDRVRLFITSEKPLVPEFEPYRLPISPERIHHALALAEFFVGDSGAMSVEAALLGTPALHLSTLAGRISVIKDLVGYGLVHDYQPEQEGDLLDRLQEMLAMPDRREHFQGLRAKLLSEKIDPLPWFLTVIRMLASGASVAEVKERSNTSIRSDM